MKTILQFIGAATIAIYSAFVISMLWLWFVVPLGLPVLSVVQVYALRMMLHVIKGVNIKHADVAAYDFNSDTDSTWVAAAIGNSLQASAAWGIGWVIHKFLI